MDNTYDSQLFAYQALLSIPAEVLMLEIYDRMDQKDNNTYAAMSLLNIGSYFATLGLAKSIYSAIHQNTPIDKASTGNYYLSPFTYYLYGKQTKQNKNSDVFEKGKRQDRLNDKVQSEPAYSERYMQIAWLLYAAKTTYATIESPIENPLGKLLYGLSQPISVMLRDRKKLT
jgi:hypothetical protein